MMPIPLEPLVSDLVESKVVPLTTEKQQKKEKLNQS